MDIRHFDAANQLVFSARGVGDPFSTILALAFEGQVYYVDRFEPQTRSFLRGTIGGATALGAAFYDKGTAYGFEGRDLIIFNLTNPPASVRHSNAFPSTFGTPGAFLRVSDSSVIGFANNRRVWDIDLDNPGSSTRRATSLPNDLNHVGGVYRVGGQIYLIGNSNTFGPGLYTFNNGATSVSRVGSFPSAVGGSVAGAVLIGDQVYFADVFATPDVLYRMTDPTDPSSAVTGGPVPLWGEPQAYGRGEYAADFGFLFRRE